MAQGGLKWLPHLSSIRNRMIERLTDENTIQNAARRIRELIDAHGEWLYAQASSGGECVRNSECDFRVSHGRLLFSCWTNQGLVVWRINGWEWTGQKLILAASRRMGAKRARLELIPRLGVEAISASISDARRERCSRLATLACAVYGRGAKVERATLSAGARSHQPGKYARILLRHHNLERIAVAGTVAGASDPDVAAFLSSTLIWFTRAGERAHAPYLRKLWLVVEKDGAESLAQLLALLRVDLRRIIRLFQIDDEWQTLTPLRSPELPEILSVPQGRYRRPPRESLSESAQEIIALAPDAIDVVRARHGETLRYHGLAFARVRRVMETESVWFGTDGGERRRLLDDTTKEEWWKLLRDLQEHRLAESADTHHALYRAAPEAWLESMLRRDITRLDPGLRLSPLYAQFRASQLGSSRPVDLLALRHDGRLVVIELKVSEDREHVFQGADYWRRTELYRRQGHLTRARLFGEATIAAGPPLVYLVAPTLRFHRSFNLLARALTPEIELYRFDINEDWRAGVRVMRCVTLTE